MHLNIIWIILFASDYRLVFLKSAIQNLCYFIGFITFLSVSFINQNSAFPKNFVTCRAEQALQCLPLQSACSKAFPLHPKTCFCLLKNPPEHASKGQWSTCHKPKIAGCNSMQKSRNPQICLSICL